MVRAIFVCVILLATSAQCLADDVKKIPDSVLQQFQKDLEKLRPEQPPDFSNGLTFQVTKPNADLLTIPNATASVMETAPPGVTYDVVSRKPGWVGVDFNGKTAWISDAVGVVKEIASGAVEEWWNEQIEKLLKEASDLKVEYDKNPYVKINGFSLNVGLPPSLTIDFEFKQ